MSTPDNNAAAIRYQALLEGMMDPVIVIGFDGIVREANRSVQSLLGYTPDQLIGKNVNVLMVEPHHANHDGYLQRYRDTGETWILKQRREFEVLCKNGDVIVCEIAVSRVDLPGQADPLFIGNFRDISSRIKAERALAQSERRFRAIFDQELQYVGLLNPDGATIEINQSAIDSTRIERNEALGLPFWETPWWRHSKEAKARIKQAVLEAARGAVVRFETDFCNREGVVRTVDFSVKPLRDEDDQISMLIAEGRDITELKRAQRAETSMLSALASIGESAAVLAHEIKNPITAVNTAIRAVADQLGEDQQAVLEELAGRMNRLKYLLTRTLSFARSLELEPVACNIPELIESAADASSALIEEKKLQVHMDLEADLTAHVDPNALDEVLVNLIRNSAQALEPNGRMDISAHQIQDNRSHAWVLSICIEDNGPGIAESMRSTLFQPFVTSKEDGTGLGLAISKKIVEAHNGQIEVGNSDLGGASFTIKLPVVLPLSD